MNIARVQLRVQAAGPGQHRDIVWGVLWYSVGEGWILHVNSQYRIYLGTSQIQLTLKTLNAARADVP